MSKGREPPVTPRSAHAQGLAPWPPRGGMGLAPRKTRLSRGDAAAEMRHPSGPQLCGTRARGSYESNARRSEAELRRRCGRGGGRRDSVLVGERGTDAPQLRLWWGAPPRPAPPRPTLTPTPPPRSQPLGVWGPRSRTRPGSRVACRFLRDVVALSEVESPWATSPGAA